jgi:DNA (cytosine-5)-methyltransferase 1
LRLSGRGKLVSKRHDAVANHVFGGGMLIGFKQAGLNVLADLETFDIGIKTLRLNYPKLDVRQHTDTHTWNIKNFDGVDVLFGNPRCTAFSTLTVGLDHRHGSEGMATLDIRQSFAVAKACCPCVFCFESVQGAATTGWPLIQKLGDELPSEYRFAIVFVNNSSFGVPQDRKRLFIVGYRGCQYGPAPFARPQRAMTVGDVIKDLEPWSVPSFKGKSCDILHFVEKPGCQEKSYLANHYVFNAITEENCDDTCQKIVAGTTIYDVDPRTCEEKLRKKREAGVGLSFHCIRRLSYNLLAPIIYSASGNYLHPVFHRSITVREAARLMCVPDDYWYTGHTMYAQVGNGVAPPTAHWIASTVVDALDGKHEDVQYRWDNKKQDVEQVSGNNDKWKRFEFTKLTPLNLDKIKQQRKEIMHDVAAWNDTEYGKRVSEAVAKAAEERKKLNKHGLLGDKKVESCFTAEHGTVNIGETGEESAQDEG